MKDVLLQLVPAFETVIVAIIGWLAIKVANFIKAKTQNVMLESALVRLSDSVFAAVKDVEMTLVAKIREANADGKVTDEEALKIKQAAVDAVKSYWGSKGLMELAKVVGLDAGGVDKFIGSKIEAAVHDLKVASSPLAAKPSA